MAQIKKINIGGEIYDIYDASAIHDLSDIESLGLEGAFIYKGTVAKVENLPTADMKTGYVYHVTENGSEYVYTTEGTWEEFGHHIVVDHTHDFSADARLTTSGDISLGKFGVTGSVTVTATNASSAVTGSGSGEVTVKHTKVSKQPTYAKVSTGTIEVLQTVGLSKSNLDTTTVSAVGTTSVISSVTPSTGSITGVSGSVTASKATAGSAKSVIKTVSKKADTTATAFLADVTDGILTLTPATVVTASGDIESETESIDTYSFADVTVPKAAEAATTVVTNVSTDSATVATKGSDVTVATGSISVTGKGSSVGIDMVPPQKATVVNTAALTTGSAAIDFYVGDVVTVTTEDETVPVAVDVTGTAAAQEITVNNASLNADCKTADVAGRLSLTTTGQINGVTGAPKE